MDSLRLAPRIGGENSNKEFRRKSAADTARTFLITMLFYFYKLIVGPFMKAVSGQNFGCRFQPSCSEYAKQVLSDFGLFEGSVMTVKRLSRCHPWHKEDKS